MLSIDDAVRAVATECNNAAAVAYARAMPRAVQEGGDHGKRVQVLYILNNMAHWRGGRSKEVRGVLKAYTA